VPDHNTLAPWRGRILNGLAGLLVQVLKITHEMNLRKLGTVLLHRIKIHANASRDSALFDGHIFNLQTQSEWQMQQLLASAVLAL
jgi:hypothetical protein